MNEAEERAIITIQARVERLKVKLVQCTENIDHVAAIPEELTLEKCPFCGAEMEEVPLAFVNRGDGTWPDYVM